MENAEGTDFDDVLSKIGFGKVHWWIFLTCGLVTMCIYNEVMGISYVVIASQCDLETNEMQKSIINNAAFSGMIVSSYFIGYLTDNIGRRKVLLYSTLLCNLMSCISALMPTFWLFVIMRFMVGIFGPGMLTSSYVAEFCQIEIRPLIINFGSIFISISMFYLSGTAWQFQYINWYLPITSDFGFRAWRTLIIIYMLPGLIGAIILCQLKESPKFLQSIGKEAETLEVLEWICVHNTGKHLADLDVHKLKSYPKRESLDTNTNILKLMWIETRPLFRRPHVINFVLCTIIMFGLFFVANGMGLWFPIILNNELAVKYGNHTVCQMWNAPNGNRQLELRLIEKCSDQITSYRATIFLGLAHAASISLIGLVIKIFKRKRAFIGCLILSGLCGLSLTWMQHPAGVIFSFVVFLNMAGIAISILVSGVIDMVPTYLRGKAICLIFLFGRLGAVVGSAFIGAFLHLTCLIAFNTFVVTIFVCALLAFLIPL